MPDGRATRVVTALRTDDVIDLFGHQLREHSKPNPDAQSQQAFLRRARQLAERLLHTRGQRVELRVVADPVGAFVYVPHSGPLVSWTCSHSPRCQQQRTRREDRHLKFYELRECAQTVGGR